MSGPAVTVDSAARLTAIAPQLLVADLGAAIAYYRDALGFVLDFTYDGFYASVSRDGCAIHLKHGPQRAEERERRKREEHLDAYIAVAGIRALYAELQQRGAHVFRPLELQPWACLDFYVEDADGYVLCFSELQQ
jgi:uncharacterized glyoxalase superfamily protein PhnB